MRVRLEGETAALNIKSREAGAKRLEFEYPLPMADALELLDRLAGTRVTEARHHVEVDGHLFEIDEFAGANAGLIVAEIELDAVDSPFPRPPWLGRELTDEARFYNLRLATTPFATWPDRDAILRREMTVIIGIAGKTLAPEEWDWIRAPMVCGVILFTRNFSSRANRYVRWCARCARCAAGCS